jgi:hypothetical protein
VNQASEFVAGGVEHERGETRLVTELFGHELVEREGVARGRAARVRTGGKNAALGGVAAGDAGVGGAGDDGEILAQVLDGLDVEPPPTPGLRWEGSRLMGVKRVQNESRIFHGHLPPQYARLAAKIFTKTRISFSEPGPRFVEIWLRARDS